MPKDVINRVKVSDYIADELANRGCEVVFGVSGGASLHLLKSVEDHPKLRLITVHHEQSVAMAAEAYSRITGKLGVGIVTSGPGATNLTTGVAGAYFDSVPCLFITGQVSTFRKSAGLGVRQYGFQETNTVDIFKPISKYVSEVTQSELLPAILSKSINEATSGRPGPVIIDIPDNIQREFIELTDLSRNSTISEEYKENTEDKFIFETQLDLIHRSLSESKSPIIICGWGTVLSKSENNFLKLLDAWNLPVVLTWGAKSLIPTDRKYLLGTFGTHGNRAANRAIQESDLIISFGSRLDTKATGTPPESFAPMAKIIMFDIDRNEFTKFESKNLKIDLFYESDFRKIEFHNFLKSLESFNLNQKQYDAWRSKIANQFAFQETYPNNSAGIEPYEFIKIISRLVPDYCRIIVDTGCSIAWTMQAWEVKLGHSIFHDFNNTAMGWSIPATLASLAKKDDTTTVCIVGDGSLMMNLGDLATIASQGKPVLIFILNNGGYSMIKQTQEQWFKSEYFASDDKTGLSFPDFKLLAQSFGFSYLKLNPNDDYFSLLSNQNLFQERFIIEVIIDPDARVIPQNRFGNPIHIMEP